MNRKAIQAARKRSKQRGTAMMEALMVNIVLVPLLAGVVYFQATYSAKIKSLQNTRAYAWTYAFHGCEEVPEDARLAVQEDFGSPGATTEPAENMENELNQSGNSVPGTGTEIDNDPTYTQNVFQSNSIGSVSATSTVQMSSFNVLKVEGSVMTSTTHVQCNLIPENESNIGGVVLQTAKNLANW